MFAANWLSGSTAGSFHRQALYAKRQIVKTSCRLPRGMQGTEQAIIALLTLVVIGTSVWAGADASRRDWSTYAGPFGLPMSWPVVFIACVALWILAFPLYLVERRDIPER